MMRGAACGQHFDAFDLAETRSIGQRSKKVFPLQVFVIGKYLLIGHSGAEEFQNRLDGIAQAANGRLAVTDSVAYGDTF